jgi:hypothetical protein
VECHAGKIRGRSKYREYFSDGIHIERSVQRKSSHFRLFELNFTLLQVCGTNIGTTILLARTLQLSLPSSDISDTSSASAPHPSPTIYALALGSNISAYTLSFSASLAGLLWVDILRQKGIRVPRSEFWRMNLSGWIVSGFVGGLGIWAVSKWQVSSQS